MLATSRMRSRRRTCALVVVLVLLASIPQSTPRGCAVCPPDCPMHLRHAEAAPGARKPGCHRAPATPDGVVCVRSACGHDAVTESPLVLRAVLDDTGVTLQVAAGARPGSPDRRHPGRTAPEPPTDPPRIVRG